MSEPMTLSPAAIDWQRIMELSTQDANLILPYAYDWNFILFWYFSRN